MAFKKAAVLLLVLGVMWTACSAAEDPKYSSIEYERHVFDENPFGFHVPGLGENPELIVELGVKWVRIQTFWRDVEPSPGMRKWTRLDSFVKKAQAINTTVMFRPQPINNWGFSKELFDAQRKDMKRSGGRLTTAHTLAYPEDMKAYLAFVRDTVERYDHDGISDMPGLKAPLEVWEIMNEFDFKWKSGTEKFKQFYRQVKATIKEADPNAKVSSGGSATVVPWALEDGYLKYDYWVKKSNQLMTRQDMQAIAQAAKTKDPTAPKWYAGFYHRRELIEALIDVGPDGVDYMDIHQYGEWDNIPGVALWLRDQMDKRGYRLPLTTSEMGSNYWTRTEAYTPEYQAEEIIKYHCVCLASGFTRIIWSSLRPHGDKLGETFNNTSLLTRDGKPKPAYLTYRLMTQKLRGLKSARRLRLPDEVPWDEYTRVYEFETASGKVYIAWSDLIRGRHLEWPWQEKGAKITHLDGTTQVAKIRQDKGPRKLILELTRTPLFFEPDQSFKAKDSSKDTVDEVNPN